MPFIEVPDRIPGIRAQAKAGQPWYRITNQTADEAEVMLYDEVGGWLGATADEFIDELKAITAPRMRVRVNSPGGGVFEGVAIANALRAHPAEVTVQIDGLAASIASVIAMAGDRVVIQPQAMVMIHDASGMCLGNAADMADMGALLDKISDNIADAYAQRAGGTRDTWRAAMQKETWYTAEEAVAAGLADEVMPAPKKRGAPEPDGDEPEMRRRYDLTAYGYQGPPPKAEPSLTINIGATLDDEMVETLRAMVRKNGAAKAAAGVKNVLRQFDEGDLVRVIGTPHEPGHTQGRVAIVNGNAYGVIFDGMEDQGVHLWYVDNELEFVAEGPDREGEGYDAPEEPQEPEPEEPGEVEEPGEAPEELRPGVSHPMGRPVPTGQAAAAPTAQQAAPDDPWASFVARLTPEDPWAAAVARFTHNTSAARSATEAA